MHLPRPTVGLRLEGERISWMTGGRTGSLPAQVARRPDGVALVPVPAGWTGVVFHPFADEAPFVRDLDNAIALVWHAAAQAIHSPLNGLIRPVLVLEAPCFADDDELRRIGRAAGAWMTTVVRIRPLTPNALRAISAFEISTARKRHQYA